MISKTFEWYRIVSPTPSSQAVEARTKAAEELIGEISAQDKHVALALAQGVACEFDGSGSEAATFEWLLRKLKLKDPAVSENLSENQLEVRSIAAITLGELLFKSEPEGLAVLAASGLVSAMTSRPLPKERYLRAMLEELSRLAIELIEKTAETRRKRSILSPLKLTIPDLPSAQKAIQQLQTQITELEQNAAMDREEISLFWFMATGFSTKKGKPFSALPVSVAAVHAALDVGRCVLAPAPLNCFEILTSIVESKRKPEECDAIALKDQFAHWSADEWEAISGADSLDEQLALNFPVVFPITWIANRMREAQSQPNWTECKKMTRLRGEAKLTASAIARQLLSEKLAVSIASETIG
jgi:GTPase-associated system helical domain